MYVGGAETLLQNLIERLDRSIINPHLVCMKESGPLGEELAKRHPVFSDLTSGKYDVRVLPRLVKLFRHHSADAIVTVGAGDKMFWGRIAAKLAGVRVITSAIHSTGWPDGINSANRGLSGITDAFIAVAAAHQDYLRTKVHLAAEKIVMIPNGIDTERFVPDDQARTRIAAELGFAADSPMVGIVAALRPEKDHLLFLKVAKQVLQARPDTKFIIVGEGQERAAIEQQIATDDLSASIRLLGNRNDSQQILPALNAFILTSKNEAKPVSILEALSCEVPVVAPAVGSISESVIDNRTGFLVPTRKVCDFADRLLDLIENPEAAKLMGRAGRQLVCQTGSLAAMVHGYERLLSETYARKTIPKVACGQRAKNARTWPWKPRFIGN